MFKSKISASIALIIVIVIIIVFMCKHFPWWFFIGLFFAYMSIFCNLMVLLVGPKAPYAARLLTKITYIFSILFFVCIAVLIAIGFTLPHHQ